MPKTETPARKTMRRSYELDLADRSLQLLHRTLGRRLLSRLAIKEMNGTTGKQDPHVDQVLAAEAEEMGVHIGDIVNNITQPITAPSPEPTPDQPATMPLWLKTALGGLILASGVSLGAGLTHYFLATPTASVDTDTQYELRLGGVE